MSNKEEILTHLFNAYYELNFAEQELCGNNEYLEEIVSTAKDKTSDAILMIKRRLYEDWMTIHNYTAITLEDKDWESYKKGACLCFAKCPSECLCGAWDLEDDFYD